MDIMRMIFLKTMTIQFNCFLKDRILPDNPFNDVRMSNVRGGRSVRF